MNLLLVVGFIVRRFSRRINPPDEGLILWSRSPIPGMFRQGSVCEDGPPLVEEILELHACSCGWKPWWRCGSGSASGRHQGIEALRTLPTTQGGSRSTWTLPPHQSTLGCDHNPLLWSRNEQISACRAFVLLRRAMPGRLLGCFALLCFRAQITLPLRRFQARQQDSSS